ncbi:type VII toxin-antitoxin system HepT family RNase toxin [Natronomonas moolapensis]|uniref:type VII toxin-antitoxin system HepT family RNase toxin n=1 Tax=Natronomonas moolapensis TaxID=416273 RepID=UPI0018D37E87|nr:HepT-like ribonuclease domain-containing protein [Natronomonas moolapensis]
MTDRAARDIVERRFVKLTEAALDIARTLVGHERGVQPDSNPAVMVALGRVDVLDDATTERMTQVARFRNVLAHTYGNAIKDDDVYDALQDLDRYRDFLFAVREYLDDTGILE